MTTRPHLRHVIPGCLLGLLIAPSISPPAGQLNVQAADSAETVLFSIPVSPEGITYAGLEHEQRPWGPAAIDVADDGSIWIADTAGNRVLGYTRSGDQIAVLDVRDRAAGVIDIASIGSRLTLLDAAVDPPRVLTLERTDGRTVASQSLPTTAALAVGLHGIAVDGDSTLYAEVANTSVPLDGTRAAIVGEPGLFGTATIQMQPMSGRHSATISYRGRSFSFNVANTLAGVSFVGDTADRSAYVVDETFTGPDGVLHVDRTVRVVRTDGTALGIARVPIATSLYVQHGVTLTPQGEVIALLARPRSVDVVILNPSPSISSLLPEQGPLAIRAAEPSGAEAVTTCRSFLDMYDTANAYRDNSKSLTATNISGSCSGRTKPRYLTVAGTYPSVSYDWDGFETVASWNSYMTQGKQAGNITTTATGGDCGKGVDCSGFVSRVWGLSTHVYTSSLDNYSTTVSGGLQQMWPFDIFLKQGSHVIFFSGWDDHDLNFYVYESTTTNSWDRVVFHLVDAAYVNGYEMRRYNNRC